MLFDGDSVNEVKAEHPTSQQHLDERWILNQCRKKIFLRYESATLPQFYFLKQIKMFDFESYLHLSERGIYIYK